MQVNWMLFKGALYSENYTFGFLGMIHRFPLPAGRQAGRKARHFIF